jgi:short-subunit dehydrogenase
MKKFVVLVTGASSGIGKRAAEYLTKKGFTVYGASRHIEPSESLPLTIKMDVTSEQSVRKGVSAVFEREGRIDDLINAAGFGIAGAVEDTSIEEAKAQCETNFFGTLQTVKAVLPIMRRQRSGYIVNFSSIGGLVGLPFQSFYSASKFAIEGFSEALRLEVKPFNIKVSVIEPGDFKTNFTQNRKKTALSETGLAYKERFLRCLSVMEHDEQNGADPIIIAKTIERILHTNSPRFRYMVGPFAEKLFVILKKFLPASLSGLLFEKYYKL